MAGMGDYAKIRANVEATSLGGCLAGFMTVAFAALYLWKHRTYELVFACIWLVLSIIAIVLYRIRKKKLQALDSN